MPKMTREELEQYKRSWCADPCWDLDSVDEEDEEYREELKAFQKEMEVKWEAERTKRLELKAEAIGCYGNIQIAAYIEGLEQRITDLSEQVEKLANLPYRLQEIEKRLKSIDSSVFELFRNRS